MKNEHRILKYANRRMYDTDVSRYITLADIRKLVVDEVPFCVIDRTTKTDVTDRTLLQALVEEVQAGNMTLPREFICENLRMLSTSAPLAPRAEDRVQL